MYKTLCTFVINELELYSYNISKRKIIKLKFGIYILNHKIYIPNFKI